VIRAGLTPKFKDVAVLCEVLTYSMGRPEIYEGVDDTPSKSKHVASSDGSAPRVTNSVYQVPTPEFQLRRVAVPRGASFTVPKTPSVGLVLVVQGNGICVDDVRHRYVVRTGHTLLVLPDTDVTFTAHSDMLLFCASEQAGTDRPSYTLASATVPVADPERLARALTTERLKATRVAAGEVAQLRAEFDEVRTTARQTNELLHKLAAAWGVGVGGVGGGAGVGGGGAPIATIDSTVVGAAAASRTAVVGPGPSHPENAYPVTNPFHPVTGPGAGQLEQQPPATTAAAEHAATASEADGQLAELEREIGALKAQLTAARQAAREERSMALMGAVAVAGAVALVACAVGRRA